MTPEKLAKIRALAEDMRGDPATRLVALGILRRELLRHAKAEEPVWHDIPDTPRNPPGVQNDPDYERHTFMSLHNWGKSGNGNFVHTTTWKGRGYRIVLFKHKKTPTWGWLRVDVLRSQEVWSGRFDNIQGAHQDAWRNLMTV